MNKKGEITKTFSMKLPFDMWIFIKMEAAKQRLPMCEYVYKCIESKKKRTESKDIEILS